MDTNDNEPMSLAPAIALSESIRDNLGHNQSDSMDHDEGLQVSDDDDYEYFQRMEEMEYWNEHNDIPTSHSVNVTDAIEQTLPVSCHLPDIHLNEVRSSKDTATLELAKDSSSDTQRKKLSHGWANDWEVVLLVDVREKENATIQSHLIDRGILCETAQLGKYILRLWCKNTLNVELLVLGDFLWAAREKSKAQNIYKKVDISQSSLTEYCFDIQTKESIRNTESISVNEDIPKITKARLDEMVILDCIVERKTVADLASSISDGRYREQKQRLMTCGVRSKSYIIEVLQYFDLLKCLYNMSCRG